MDNDNYAQYKASLTEALQDWIDDRIDDYAAGNAHLSVMSKYLKRGVHNYIRLHGKAVDNATSAAMLFLVEADGSCDWDTLMQDVIDGIRAMPETPVNLGGIKGVVGNGCIKIIMPDNPLLSILTDNTTAVKITMDDITAFLPHIKERLTRD